MIGYRQITRLSGFVNPAKLGGFFARWTRLILEEELDGPLNRFGSFCFLGATPSCLGLLIKQLEQQVHKNLQICFGLLFTRTVETNLDTPD